MMKNFEELAFKAGFTGKDLSNTQFGTSYKHALCNFMELIIQECTEQCMSDDYKNILNHFNIPLDEDEDLSDE